VFVLCEKEKLFGFLLSYFLNQYLHVIFPEATVKFFPHKKFSENCLCPNYYSSKGRISSRLIKQKQYTAQASKKRG